MRDIIHKVSTGSTNDDVAQLGRAGSPHMTAVLADFQTGGRGRRGNRWVAPAGSSLLFSVLLRPDCDPSLWSRIPQIAGMEMVHAVETMCGSDDAIKLKWPNDLYHHDRKWAGILVESDLGDRPFAVLGIGVNLNGRADELPDEVQESATTLQAIYGGGERDRRVLLDLFLNRLEHSLDLFLSDFSPVATFANRRDVLVGRKVLVEQGGNQVSGTASGIGSEGELLVYDRQGHCHKITSGSVIEWLTIN